ncbi:methyltransferase domain-containing protein [Teichococcus vastitatis]|uniref:Methyltransferase domain-containing protein n=1 Tax=Teichococcus vastitatis TaxID=2307076 RepID=A0ABS9W4P9_9PROT|nr:methyltransferase domain-containing protein [Pseudoroseomonas vastitatis]MCI0754013.1 methyltransferase domain-containing protein [Pseudoroseomonas vastitatis]
MLTARPGDAPPAALLAAVDGRYAGASRFARGYVRGKLRRDPATAAILALAAGRPFGSLLDLGCGRGQLALALLLAGGASSVTGFDLDARKIAEAEAAAAGLPARFAAADLAATPLPQADTILMVDVLYQMPEPAQRRLLIRIAGAARQRVVIRAFDPGLGWRSRAGLAMEWLNRAARGAAGASIRPLPLADLAEPLENAGFRVEVRPCWGRTPLPNVLVLAERVARA